jgi:hypothetical protein
MNLVVMRTIALKNESYLISLLFVPFQTRDGRFRRVICLSPAGQLLFESVPLDGVPTGTPQATHDGQYIMITHNTNQTVGIFTVLDVGSASSGGAIPAVYAYQNDTNPFSPIGVYHQPALGYYDGGENNTNDIFIWAFDTAAGSSVVGTGAIFGFQLPMDASGNYTVAPLGDRDFQASTAPVLTNRGVSMYWAVTRAEQYCWVGNPATKREFFNRGRTNKVSLDRGDPAWVSGRATPSLSFAVNSTDDQVVFGPGASNEIFRLNSNYTEVLTANTSYVVSSRVAVSPDNQVVYYASQDGIVAQLKADTLEQNWQFSTLAGVYADITLNSAGTVLYVVDNSGVIMAMQVASSSAPTASPTMPGTSDFPSAVPTGGPGDSSPVPTVEGGGGGVPAAPTAGGGGGGAPTSTGGGGEGPTSNSTGTSAASRLSRSSSSAWVVAATAVAAISGWTLYAV